MLSVGEEAEADALFKRGWTVSAIARHLERDRKTVRSYLNGDWVAGVRHPSKPDALDDYRVYVAARFVDDPHLWASALFDEVVALGYRSSYVSFARQVRLAGLRPHCEACSGVKGRETIEIDRPAGEEIQWDWFERAVATLDGVIADGSKPPSTDELRAVVTLIALAHGEWVRIHLFANGNGHTARMWACWAALRYGLPAFVEIKSRPADGGYGRASSASMGRPPDFVGDHRPAISFFGDLLALYQLT
jgi:hypothetical protein